MPLQLLRTLNPEKCNANDDKIMVIGGKIYAYVGSMEELEDVVSLQLDLIEQNRLLRQQIAELRDHFSAILSPSLPI